MKYFFTPRQVLFDHNGVLRKYETVEDILKEFFELRKKYYYKRKAYLVGMLEAEASKLSNQVTLHHLLQIWKLLYLIYLNFNHC